MEAGLNVLVALCSSSGKPLCLGWCWARRCWSTCVCLRELRSKAMLRTDAKKTCGLLCSLPLLLKLARLFSLQFAIARI